MPVRRLLDVWLIRLASYTLPATGVRGQIMLGGQMWLVLVVPSRDRAGRLFPLALLCPFAAQDHALADGWCDAALGVLKGQDADGLFASLPPPPLNDASDAEQALWFAGQPASAPDQVLAQLSSG